ncbi:MAG: FAD-binding oxidoreductase [Candidatus Dormibacteraceae bacterium]
MTIDTERPATVDSLAAELSESVLQPGAPGWKDAIASFNRVHTHTPDLVVCARTASDVQAAVRFAAAQRLPVGVRATGHGATVPIDAGVLVSTRLLDSVRIDPARRTATVGAGARWRSVIDLAAPHGLAPLNGSSSDVGVVGYTLGGGLPVIGRTFGFSADRVCSLEVVTADGKLHRVDADTDPELFWALRGGAGNVGIVTEMTVELVEVASILAGGIFFAAEHIPRVLRAYREWSATLPDVTSTSLAVLRLPPLPDIPEPLRGRIVAHLRFCHVGDPGDGERQVSLMRSICPVLMDTVHEMPYREIDTIHQDPQHPVPVYERSLLLRELTEETVAALLGVVGPEVHSTVMVCELRQMGGALRSRPCAPSAVGGRDAAFALIVIGALAPPITSQVPPDVDRVIASVAPWSTGQTLLNLHGAPGDEADRSRAWDPATYERLRDLVRRVDPAGLFCFGHAIERDRGIGRAQP